MSDWLGPDVEIDLSTKKARKRAIRIIRSASWIVRMHRSFNGTFDSRNGVHPPGIPWRELVANLLYDDGKAGS